MLIIAFAFPSSFDAAAADPAGGYYQRLADAFLHGQASLRQAPPDWLVAAANPYDPVVSAPVRVYGIHDAILTEGRYWYYWGPGAVAFLVAPLRAVGLTATETDLALVALIILAWCGIDAAVLAQSSGRWSSGMAGIMGLALALPFSAMFLVQRLAIWEANVLVCAALTGLAIQAFARSWLGLTRRPTWLILLGCLAAFMATTVRTEAIVVFLLPIAQVALARWRPSDVAPGPRLALVMPILAGLASLGVVLAYNALRFGNALEFNVTRMLAGADQSTTVFSSVAYTIPNLYNYLVRPVALGSTAPFLDFTEFRWSRPVAGTYESLEPVAGIGWTTPWLVAALTIGVIGALWGLRRAGGPQRSPSAILLGVSLICIGAGQLFFLSTAMFAATQRYLVAPGLILCVGALLLVAGIGNSSIARLGRPAMGGLAVIGIFLSFMGAAHGYYPPAVASSWGANILNVVAPPVLRQAGMPPRVQWTTAHAEIRPSTGGPKSSPSNASAEISRDGTAANIRWLVPRSTRLTSGVMAIPGGPGLQSALAGSTIGTCVWVSKGGRAKRTATAKAAPTASGLGARCDIGTKLAPIKATPGDEVRWAIWTGPQG